MFTGIIETVGKLVRQQSMAGDRRLHIATGDMEMSDVALGDSIAVNGVCLTVVALHTHEFCADVSNETLSHTTLGELKAGAPLNLERAMQLTTRLGGHLVSGHVDGVGRVQSRRDDGRSVRFNISVPKDLAKYVATKGSVCVDGVSLTVNRVDGANFDINIVPHTLSKTIIAGYKEGTLVNIEVDIVARYLERLLIDEKENGKRLVTENLLRDAGFLS